MAPQKSVFLLITLSMALGLATANSFEDPSQDEAWVNNGAEIDFEVQYSNDCKEDQGKVEILEGQNSEGTLGDGEQVKDEDGNDVPRTYEYSYNFEDAGSYTVKASCSPKEDNGDPIDIDEPEKDVEVGDLDLGLDVPEETVYEGDNLEGEVDAETNNDNLEYVEYEYRFHNRDEKDDRKELRVEEDGSFAVEASDSDLDSFEVFASPEGQDFEETESTEVDIQDVWQIRDLSVSANEEIDDDDYTVKYRNLDQLELSFRVTEEGEGVTGLSSDDFLLDSEDYNKEDDWFEAEPEGDGRYSLSIDGRPVFSEDDLSVDDSVDLDVLLNDGEIDETVLDAKIEKDVEFSGRVLDVSNNRVDTSFEAVYDGRARSFETDDSGRFEKYINTEKVDMVMDFPEASVSLKDMQVDKEDPGDISYNYYEDLEDSGIESDKLPEDVRPVNLASFISNYNFDGDSIDTFVDMEFDTSDIRPEDTEVYECNEWTFRAEECSGDWDRISNNDVTLESGATWNAEFPITPRESDRFESDKGVLSNAYLVGVPEGVGAGLALANEPDYSSSRVKSGEEFSISGKIISDSTGEPVEDANVELELLDEDGDGPSDDDETSEDGSFELSTEVEDAGTYEVVLSASKNPYESLEISKKNDKLDVYYETGLSIESDSNPEIGLGEDYNIEYDIENVGQASVDDIELSVSGVDNGETSLNPTSISSLEPGSSQTVVLTVNLDEDLRTPPSITFEAEGTSADKTVTQTSSTLVSLADDATTSNQEDTQETQESQQGSQQNDSSGSIPNPSEIQQVTGEFIESQSQMNLALGLILVFAAILAVAVKNKDGDSREMRGRGQGRGQSRVQAPQVTPQEEEEPESESEASEKEESTGDQSSEESSDEESDSFKCDVCGETFDTESGMNLHKQALH